MTFPLTIADELRRAIAPGASVLLGISGGVDSAVSLAVLEHLDCEVHAVTFKNFCYSEQEDSDRACCSLEAIDEARALALRHGARHWVHDVAPAFRTQVIEPFVADYSEARTPNPCLNCNSTVRFPELVRLADQIGCDLVATGHYARTRPDAEGTIWLHRGLDPDKDQSYFLSHVPRAMWSRVVFPLGWSRKPDVREAARALGLRVANKPESQEICFVPDGDRSFLFPDGAMGRPGPIVDRDGRVLGEHRGLGHYTVGQRRGLGIAHPEPLYVTALDAARNRLVVGTRDQTAVRTLQGERMLAFDPRFAVDGEAAGDTIVAQVRHRHGGARVAAWRRDGDRVEVDLAEPVHAAAPGQGLTLYADDRVVACGRLTAVTASADTERGEA
jgi:tRNA-specific 2-thiouridylase